MGNRREFLKKAGVGSALLSSVASFANIIVPTQKRVLGVALVGLGYYSRDLLAPALQLTEHCQLKGIVTGTPSKIPIWQKQYGIADQQVYNYQNMNNIANDPAIDVVYIVLPTGLHSQYAVKAAESGKHVWCEKPMARTALECQQIINACEKNKVQLSIGYRMQHEPNTQQIIDFAKDKPLGKIELVEARAGYFDNRSDHWKQNKVLGGGAMYDMGVYSLNAARYASGEEPINITARHETNRPEIYHEVDETTFFDLEFPSGAKASCATSLGMGMNELKVTTANGNYGLNPFQAYNGIKGNASNGVVFSAVINNQQAKQMDDDALAIINHSAVIVPGEEGMKDIAIVEAAYRSAKENMTIQL